jgi:hypothetical protein
MQACPNFGRISDNRPNFGQKPDVDGVASDPAPITSGASGAGGGGPRAAAAAPDATAAR